MNYKEWQKWYFCPKCHKKHHYNSKIGKKHLKQYKGIVRAIPRKRAIST